VLLTRLDQFDLAVSKMLEADKKLDPSNPLTHYQPREALPGNGKTGRGAPRVGDGGSIEAEPLAPLFINWEMVYRRLGEEAKARKAVQTFEELTSREKAAKMDPIDANLEE
jgi:hypothetical protein